MDRRLLVGLIALVALISIVVGVVLLTDEDDADTADAGNYNVGILVMDHMIGEMEGFQAEMAERGFVEGENITYNIYMFEAGELPDAETVADFDVLLALEAGDGPEEPLGRAFDLADGETPIVFVADNNYPLDGGYIESVGRPGKNVTGVLETSAHEKRLELFVQLVPEAKRMLVPYEASEEDSTETHDMLSDLAASFDVELVFLPIDEFGDYAENYDDDVDAVFSLGAHDIFAELVEFTLTHRLPLSDDGTNVEPLGLDEKGYSLLRVDVDTEGMSAQAAAIVERIFEGTDAADIPVENAQSIIFIDLVNADILGIEVEESVLQKANEIVRAE